MHTANAPTGPFGQAQVEKVEATLGEANSSALKAALQAPGNFDSASPHVLGWCEVHFSHLLTSAEVDYVTRAVVDVATSAWKLLPQYMMDPSSGALASRAVHAVLPAQAGHFLGEAFMTHYVFRLAGDAVLSSRDACLWYTAR